MHTTIAACIPQLPHVQECYPQSVLIAMHDVDAGNGMAAAACATTSRLYRCATNTLGHIAVSLGLPLGLEAPVMMPDGVFVFYFFVST